MGKLNPLEVKECSTKGAMRRNKLYPPTSRRRTQIVWDVFQSVGRKASRGEVGEHNQALTSPLGLGKENIPNNLSFLFG